MLSSSSALRVEAKHFSALDSTQQCPETIVQPARVAVQVYYIGII